MICEKSTVFTSSIEKLKRDVFRSHMNTVMTSKYFINSTKSTAYYLMSIKKEPGNIIKDMLVFEQFEFDIKSEEEKFFINKLKGYSKNQEKHFPFGGIALNLTYFTV